MQESRGAPKNRRAYFSGCSVSSSARHSSWRWDLAICLLLGLVFFLIYNANQRSMGAADTYPARYLPLSILKHHSLTLDPIVSLVAQGREVPAGKSTTAFWMIKSSTGSIVSLYPIVTPVVVAPLYLPAVAYLDAKGWDLQRVDFVARIMEKLCASLIASLSAMLLYLLLRRRSPPATAALLTIAYALGTTTWVISSQALWMHGLGGLLVVALLYLLTGPCTPLRALGAGLFCALLACNRQPDTILAAGFALYAIRWAGGRFPWFLGAALVPVGLVLAYNLLVVGHIVGGYGLLPPKSTGVSQFGEDTLFGIGVLLFSPVYGLFVFSPFLLFVPLFLISVLREPSSRWLTLAAGGALVLQMLFYSASHWEQGLSWGPRYLTESIPILMWMLPPVLERLRTTGRVVFGLTCVVAVAIQSVGAFCYTGKTFGAAMAAYGPIVTREAWKQLVWDIDNTPFITEGYARVAPDLGELRGYTDVAGARDEADARHLLVAGWALMDGHTPSDVALIVDGKVVVGGTDTFFDRPDVVRGLGESAPSGWRVTFPADSLAPGKHVVTALVRAHSDGQQRILETREFTVTDSAPELVQGRIDEAGTRDENDPQRIMVTGWALMNNQTPSDVTVMVDGQVVGSGSETFFERPDVVRELGKSAHSGWRVTFPADVVVPGKHVVTALVRAHSDGQQHILESREFTVTDSVPRPVRGRIDVVGTRDESDNRRMVVAGWALMNNQTPADVTVMVDDKVVGSGTEAFFERPDVVLDTGESAPSGWRVTFPANRLEPGEHVVSVRVRAHSGGPQRLLETRGFTVTKRDSELDEASRRAAVILAERQDRLGYWLSEFSKTTQFVQQGQELNIFTNAALIDLVAPVAQQSGLADSMTRARQFLTSQIEDSGLVRYHGRPDLTTMGVLGCVITPDADDTALTWRIAPSERSELRPLALSTLKQFRTADGLYQTWLAPKADFRCIDPGKNPNPPDIGIQLHVYLWLAQVDPPAARELCTALQAREADESLWVYYRFAPPIVLLRLNEVSKAGCPLQLPSARLQTTVAGQDIWLELLDHLHHFETADDLTAGRTEAIALLLKKLAADNFAALKSNPPLLYHNDLSASVSRYYWSKSFGYALWLRLYYENQRTPSFASSADNGQSTEKGSRP